MQIHGASDHAYGPAVTGATGAVPLQDLVNTDVSLPPHRQTLLPDTTAELQCAASGNEEIVVEYHEKPPNRTACEHPSAFDQPNNRSNESHKELCPNKSHTCKDVSAPAGFEFSIRFLLNRNTLNPSLTQYLQEFVPGSNPAFQIIRFSCKGLSQPTVLAPPP
jgi:hypothetical protein